MTLNIWAIIASGLVGFITTTLWYVIFQSQLKKFQPAGSGAVVDFKTAPAASKVIDFLRGFVVATVLAYLIARTNTTTLTGSVSLALVLWVGFPVILLIGPVIWGRQPWKLSALHSGDWLIKLLAMSAVLAVWK